jgi:hypothetical protein
MPAPPAVGGSSTAPDEDLAAVHVVAEHVQAGAGRAQQHGVAGCACSKHQATWPRAAWRGAARARRCRPAASMAAASRPISATARAWRAPARQRAEVLPLAVAAQDHHQLGRRLVGTQAVQRGHGGADVGALGVVEGLDTADGATDCTRCGSPTYSRRPCSMGASGQPMAVASASAASALAALWRPRTRSASAGIRRCRWISSTSPLRRLRFRRRRQCAHQPGHAVFDHQAEVTGLRGASRPKRMTLRA